MEGESFLWLIRHAPVDGAVGAIHAPGAPANLGDRATLELLERSLPKDAQSYASPWRRTIDTARALGLDPAPVPDFTEQDFGDWTGQHHDDLARSDPAAYAKFWRDPAREKPPGGESFEDQIVRVGRGLSSIGDGPAVLVVHSGTIRAALCVALDLTPQAGLRFVIDPLSLTRIDRLATRWRVVSVNQRIA